MAVQGRHGLKILAAALVAVLASRASAANAAACDQTCPTSAPASAWRDIDNNGCFDAGTDEADIDAALLAGAYDAGAAGIVVPFTARLSGATALVWSAQSVAICARVTAASLAVTATGGDIVVGRKARLEATAGALELTATGDVLIDEVARLAGAGLVLAADGTLEIRTRTRILSAADVELGGDECSMGRAVSLEATGTLAITCDGGLAVGDRVRAAIGGDFLVDAGTAWTTGVGPKLEAAGAVLAQAADIDLGRRTRLTGDDTLALAASGDVLLGKKALVRAPLLVDIDAGDAIVLDLKARLKAQTSKRTEGEPGDLTIDAVSFEMGPQSTVRFLRNATVEVATMTAASGTVFASDAVTFKLEDATSSLRLRPSAELVLEGTDLKAETIEIGRTPDAVAASPFTLHRVVAKGPETDLGGTLTFTNVGVCDLEGSRFKFLAVDTSGCSGGVLGP